MREILPNYFPHGIENPMAVGVTYYPPSQTSVWEQWMNISINLTPSSKKPNIFGDFNINLY